MLPKPSEATEPHYSPTMIAGWWGLSKSTVIELFRGEPGVIKIGNDRSAGDKRRYQTLAIPHSVAERVHRQLSE